MNEQGFKKYHYKSTELSQTLVRCLTKTQKEHWKIIREHNRKWAKRLFAKRKTILQLGYNSKKAHKLATDKLESFGLQHIDEHSWLTENYGISRENQKRMVIEEIERRSHDV